MPIIIPENIDPASEYCPVQRLLAHMLQTSLKDAIKGDKEILAWIYDDGLPNHKYRVPFGKFCSFLNIDHEVIIEGIETRAEKMLNARSYMQTRSYNV